MKDQITHGSKELTLNQAIAMVMVDSMLIKDSEEKLKLSLVVCKLEFFRSQRLYNEEIAKGLYRHLWDIYSYKSKYEQILDLGKYLDQQLLIQNKQIQKQNYVKIVPTVSNYFDISAEQYEKDLMQLLEPKRPKPKPQREIQEPVDTKGKKKKKKTRFLFFKK